jgi:hypothetical protein
MRTWQRKLALSCLLGLCVAVGGQAFAQDAGGGGGRGNRDPQQQRQRMMDRMKEQMGATDEEWKALEPRIQKVMAAQRDARTGGFNGFGGGRGGRGGGGGGGGGGGDANANPSPVREARRAVQAAIDDGNTSPQDLAAKLKAYRDARDKAREDLTSAQKELKELLSQKQEAVLLMSGMIE